jgi:hypothetical protein
MTMKWKRLLLTIFIIYESLPSLVSCLSVKRRESRRNFHVYLHSTAESVNQNLHATPSCPFSKVFPRYRIDLTSIQSERKRNFQVPFLSDWIKATTRSKFLQSSSPGTDVLWLENLSGVQATAMLWRSTTNVSQGHVNATLLAFPDTKAQTIRQWVDVFYWLQDKRPRDSCRGVTVEYLAENKVPVVLIERQMEEVVSSEIPDSNTSKVIKQHTQAWVKRILVELGICPFTKTTKMSGQGLMDLGISPGSIAYHSSFAKVDQICFLMADTWEAISDMIAAGPSGKEGVSSILLAAPDFDDDFDLWSGPIFAMLEAGVLAASAEKEVGIVCFHPKYATPDGSSWPGFGHMHSVPRLKTWLLEDEPSCPLSDEEIAAGGAWQRRTPHATINVLRADQLSAAEGRRKSIHLYSENIRKLVGGNGIGSEKLQEDLDRERSIHLSES